MNNIKSTFSIKDLENLSGIKAHTIRIWEKRYNLLQPDRTDTNIRTYSLISLQKLLNVSYLNSNGVKISKIAKLSESEINDKVKLIAHASNEENHSINALKIAMINFDQSLFYNTYNKLLLEYTFKDVFHKIFIPFLEEIGLLWQTNTITPAHEHFITELIKHKIILNTEKAVTFSEDSKDLDTYVLFLPDNEVHELGLLYLNYELISKGYHTIYLGQSVPTSSLKDIKAYYNNITFVSSYTVYPTPENINTYVSDFITSNITNTNNKFWAWGRMIKFVTEDLQNHKNVTLKYHVKDIINVI